MHKARSVPLYPIPTSFPRPKPYGRPLFERRMHFLWRLDLPFVFCGPLQKDSVQHDLLFLTDRPNRSHYRSKPLVARTGRPWTWGRDGVRVGQGCQIAEGWCLRFALVSAAPHYQGGWYTLASAAKPVTPFRLESGRRIHSRVVLFGFRRSSQNFPASNGYSLPSYGT